MKIKLKISIILICLAIGLYFLTSAQEGNSIMNRFTVDKFILKKHSYINKPVLLMGIIKEGSVNLKGDNAEFILESKNKTLPVYFNGPDGIPDTFKEGSQALLEGSLNSNANLFIAYKVTTKCASKFSQTKL